MPIEKPDLSRGEWLVMNLCWEQGKTTARQVFEAALAKKKWSYQTVKTMLDRLVVKGYLRGEKEGAVCIYEPAVAREKVVGRSIETFWSTVLDSTLAPLFAHLAKGRKLSREEIDSLKRLINEHEEGKGDGRRK